jgi:phosphate transport system substrate-binding protein
MLSGASTGRAAAVEITGAGSTFVYPLLAKWADAYKKETGIRLNYQSIGSGGGIKQIESGTVDFGASDMPLAAEVLDKEGLVQFPIVNGAVVPVVHIRGVDPGRLKLSGELLAGIFMGKIEKWNDPAVTALNPGLALPEQNITVVHRSDGSGTSFIFTNYLSKVNPAWKTEVGEGTAVSWPAGVGGKGNEGVAAYIKRIEGSIGYLEYAYVVQNKMIYTRVKNKAGQFVVPETAAFAAAVRGAEWSKAERFHLILTDAPGWASWPIAGTTFALLRKTGTAEQTRRVLSFFEWAYAQGTGAAAELRYVPLTPDVVKLVKQTWRGQFKTEP